MFATTRVPELLTCKTCLYRANEVLEWFYGGTSMMRNSPATDVTREGDCKRFVKAAGRVASAPPVFCDARQAPLRTNWVVELAARGYLGVAVVDGSLGAHELAELSRVTADWSVVVVAETTPRVA